LERIKSDFIILNYTIFSIRNPPLIFSYQAQTVLSQAIKLSSLRGSGFFLGRASLLLIRFEAFPQPQSLIRTCWRDENSVRRRSDV